MNYSEKILKKFIKDYSLPIQVATNEMLPYYIDLYDPIYSTKQKWEMFKETVSKFDTDEGFLSYGQELTDRVIDAIKSTEAYNYFTTCDPDVVMPIHKELGGIPYKKSINIYKPYNTNKYFISIDLRKANYQALRFFDSDIVLGSDTYEDMIGQFTSLGYFKQSKFIRQVIFGNLNNPRITRYERCLNEKVLDWILRTNYPKDKIVDFTTDEIILECQPQVFLGSRGCNIIQEEIYKYSGVNVKVEDFRLKYIGNDTYIKEHPDNIPPTFKGGSSVYFPQAYKAYMNMPLKEEDLYFMYEKQLAQFKQPMKWEVK